MQITYHLKGKTRIFLEILGPSLARFLVGGPSGQLWQIYFSFCIGQITEGAQLLFPSWTNMNQRRRRLREFDINHMAISAMLAISALAKTLNSLVRCVFGYVFSSQCWAWLLATFPTLWHRWKLIVRGPEGDYERWSDLDVQHISWKDSNAAKGCSMYCQNWNQTSWSGLVLDTLSCSTRISLSWSQYSRIFLAVQDSSIGDLVSD